MAKKQGGVARSTPRGPSPLPKIVREKLIEMRKEIGYTHRKLSAETGITEASIRNYEQGHTRPMFDHLCDILKVLDVPPTTRDMILKHYGWFGPKERNR